MVDDFEVVEDLVEDVDSWPLADVVEATEVVGSAFLDVTDVVPAEVVVRVVTDDLLLLGFSP